jgi:hypothetical protein
MPTVDLSFAICILQRNVLSAQNQVYKKKTFCFFYKSILKFVTISETAKFSVLRHDATPSRNLSTRCEQEPKEFTTPITVPNEYFTNSDLNSVKTFCRCCLKLDARSRDMKGAEMFLDGAKVNLFEAFFDCTSFKILPDIDDQAQICLSCSNSLEMTILFLSQCQTSNNLLTELFLNQEDPSEMEVDAEEEEVDDDDLLVPMKVHYTLKRGMYF